MPRGAKGAAIVTTITTDLGSSDLLIPIAASDGWPTGSGAKSFTALVVSEDGLTREKVLCSSRTGLTLTVATRGYDDTLPQAFLTGATIKHVWPAAAAQELDDHLYDTDPAGHSSLLNNTRHDTPTRHQIGGALGDPSAPLSVTTTNQEGTGTDPAREDHQHKLGDEIAGNGLALASGVLGVVVDDATITISGDTVKVKDGGIDTTQLASQAVEESTIAPNTVTPGKIHTDVAGAGLAMTTGVLSTGVDDSTIEVASDVLRVKDGGVTFTKMTANAPRGEIDYKEVSAGQTGISTTNVDLTGLVTSALTVPANRKYYIEGYIRVFGVGPDANTYAELGIYEGATEIQTSRMQIIGAGQAESLRVTARIIPSAGSHTYKLTLKRNSGGASTLSLSASATEVCYLLVNDIGGT